MRTVCDINAIAWHLGANAFGLSPAAKVGILNEVELFNAGEKTLSSFIGDPNLCALAGDHLTLSELFDDFQIEITD